MSAMNRTCSACGGEKPESEFYKRKGGKTVQLYSSHCKECVNVRRQAYWDTNKDRLKAKAKDWRTANRENQRERSKKYREANREVVRARCRAWHHANKEKARRFGREWREKNRERLAYLERTKRAEFRSWIDELKSKPCVDCNRTFPPYAMDFDHRDGSEKEAEVSVMVKKPREAVLAEIAKCDLVCACCHRIRTWTRNRERFDREEASMRTYTRGRKRLDD